MNERISHTTTSYMTSMFDGATGRIQARGQLAEYRDNVTAFKPCLACVGPAHSSMCGALELFRHVDTVRAVEIDIPVDAAMSIEIFRSVSSCLAHNDQESVIQLVSTKSAPVPVGISQQPQDGAGVNEEADDQCAFGKYCR